MDKERYWTKLLLKKQGPWSFMASFGFQKEVRLDGDSLLTDFSWNARLRCLSVTRLPTSRRVDREGCVVDNLGWRYIDRRAEGRRVRAGWEWDRLLREEKQVAVNRHALVDSRLEEGKVWV